MYLRRLGCMVSSRRLGSWVRSYVVVVLRTLCCFVFSLENILGTE